MHDNVAMELGFPIVYSVYNNAIFHNETLRWYNQVFIIPRSSVAGFKLFIG